MSYYADSPNRGASAPYTPLMHRPDSDYSLSAKEAGTGHEMGVMDPFAGGGYGHGQRDSVASMGYSYSDADMGGGGVGEFDPQSAAARRRAERRSMIEASSSSAAAAAGGGYAAAGAGAGGGGDHEWTPNFKPQSNKKRWIWLGVGLLVLVAVGVGVGVGVSTGLKHGANSQLNTGSTNSTGGNGSSGSGTSSGTDSSVLNGGDPSQFEKDSRLHNSFWGLAYTTDAFQLPWCGAVQANITRDIQIMSQLTTRIRLYGANCNQTAMVLQAIQDAKVDMGVYVAIYVDSNQTAYDTQLTAIEDALKTYGADHVLGVTVGNEYILNQAGSAAAVSKITSDAASVNTTIKGLGLSKQLPVGTSDAGSELTETLAAGIDYFHANVHPWFADGVTIENAATWTWDFFQEFDVDVAAQAPNKPDTAIAETGWPTKSLDTADPNKSGVTGSIGAPSVANLQTFLDTFVCQANQNQTEYFFFEAFDEPWKVQFGTVEPYWGLFDSDRNLKNITIPNCSHS